MILAVQGHDLFIKRFAALTLPKLGGGLGMWLS